jgi:hypothetical protein
MILIFLITARMQFHRMQIQEKPRGAQLMRRQYGLRKRVLTRQSIPFAR